MDPMTIASIASAGSSVLGGLFGGKKKGTGTQLTPFQSLPAPVQDTYLNTYLPAVKDNFAKEYNPFPMKRAVNPMDDPFASHGAYEWQQYSDQMGGLFSPFGVGKGAPETPVKSDEVPASIKEVLNQIVMSQIKNDANQPWTKNNTSEYNYRQSLKSLMDEYAPVADSLDWSKLYNAKEDEYVPNILNASKTASEALRKYLLMGAK